MNAREVKRAILETNFSLYAAVVSLGDRNYRVTDAKQDKVRILCNPVCRWVDLKDCRGFFDGRNGMRI
jgi:hypothetical protein